jgi:hypothetical protein
MVSEIDDAEMVVVDIKAVANGYRLSRLIRSTVFNDREEDIGTLDLQRENTWWRWSHAARA